MVRCISVSATKRTISSPLYIFVDIQIAGNIVKVSSATTEMQKLVLLALLSSYKILYTAVNIINVIRSSCNVSDVLSILYKIGVPRRSFVCVPSIKFHENLSSGSRAHSYGHAEGQMCCRSLLNAKSRK